MLPSPTDRRSTHKNGRRLVGRSVYGATALTKMNTNGMMRTTRNTHSLHVAVKTRRMVGRWGRSSCVVGGAEVLRRPQSASV